ncbi:MAG: RNA polymerase sporulation sigma factor SigK [Clostridia bacterium]|nr:RNA polymerase sporulation sigma factor SigK [Clostridia bacterium]
MVFETLGAFMSKLMFFHGYVNEFNGFPNPLTREEENLLIEQMQNGNKNARQKLINHNLRLVAHVAKKYQGSAEADELLSVGSIGLIKGIDSFKQEKGSQLSTYVSRCIENEILMLLRATKKHRACVSIEETIGVDKDGGELTFSDIIPQDENDDPGIVVEKRILFQETIKLMKTKLEKREYEILSLRYGIRDGIEHTQQEVADILKISRSYISRIENKALEMLRNNLLKDNHISKINNFRKY